MVTSLSEVVSQRRNFDPKIKLCEIAAESGLSEPTICRIESKKAYSPRYETAMLVIRAMRALRKGRKRLPREEGTA